MVGHQFPDAVLKIYKLLCSPVSTHCKKIQFSATSIENGHREFCIFCVILWADSMISEPFLAQNKTA